MTKKNILLFIYLLLFIITGFNSNATGESLYWEKPAVGIVTGYIIHYGTTADNLNNSINVGNVTTKQLDQLTLKEKNTYFFAISAYNTECESEFSNIVNWTVPDRTPPMSPSNVKAY